MHNDLTRRFNYLRFFKCVLIDDLRSEILTLLRLCEHVSIRGRRLLRDTFKQSLSQLPASPRMKESSQARWQYMSGYDFQNKSVLYVLL